jgi:hypothetical protein
MNYGTPTHTVELARQIGRERVSTLANRRNESLLRRALVTRPGRVPAARRSTAASTPASGPAAC